MDVYHWLEVYNKVIYKLNENLKLTREHVSSENKKEILIAESKKNS